MSHVTHMNESCHTHRWYHPFSIQRDHQGQISRPTPCNSDTPTHCNTLHHTQTHSSTLQHTPTHSNTLQHAAWEGRRMQNKRTYQTSLVCHTTSLQHDHFGNISIVVIILFPAAEMSTLPQYNRKNPPTPSRGLGEFRRVGFSCLWLSQSRAGNPTVVDQIFTRQINIVLNKTNTVRSVTNMRCRVCECVCVCVCMYVCKNKSVVRLRIVANAPFARVCGRKTW